MLSERPIIEVYTPVEVGEGFTLTQIASISSYESLIWTMRYDEAGDFELYILDDGQDLKFLREYVSLFLSIGGDELMVVLGYKYDLDQDGQAHYTISGKSLEYVLSARCICPLITADGTGKKQRTVYDWQGHLINVNTGSFEFFILSLFFFNFADWSIVFGSLQITVPEWLTTQIKTRATSLFALFADDHAADDLVDIQNLTLSAKAFGENAYDTIVKLCREQKVGFKIRLTNDANIGDRYAFQLYSGKDRSNRVTFSRELGNLKEAHYTFDSTNLNTAAIIKGEAFPIWNTGIDYKYGDRVQINIDNPDIDVRLVYFCITPHTSSDETSPAREESLYVYWSLIGPVIGQEGCMIATDAYEEQKVIREIAEWSNSKNYAANETVRYKITSSDAWAEYLSLKGGNKNHTPPTTSLATEWWLFLGLLPGEFGYPEGVDYPVYIGGVSDLYRKEIFIDASSLKNEYTDVNRKDEYYVNALKQKGWNELYKASNRGEMTFDATVDNNLYRLYEDYALGDLVSIKFDDGLFGTVKMRVSAITINVSAEGYSINPTFTFDRDDVYNGS